MIRVNNKRKHRQQADLPLQNRVQVVRTDDAIEPIEVKPSRYSPPDCPACRATREAIGNTNRYTEVYATKRDSQYVYRYVRCGWCSNTFKVVQFIG